MEKHEFSFFQWPNHYFLTIIMKDLPISNGEHVCFSKNENFNHTTLASDLQKEIGNLLINLHVEDDRCLIKKAEFKSDGITIEKFIFADWKVLGPIMCDALTEYFAKSQNTEISFTKSPLW